MSLMYGNIQNSLSSMKLPLVLASSSKSRRAVLDKLQLEYAAVSPDIDELPQPGESASQLVKRLSIGKAASVSHRFNRHLIIGSDQVAVQGQTIVGKPKDRDDAIAQLHNASGQQIHLYTGVALINSETGDLQADVLPYRVVFRKLSAKAIEDYVDRDQPYDCGGSLRSEGLGVALLSEFDGTDPNILLGLPLIRLIDMLAVEGVHPLCN